MLGFWACLLSCLSSAVCAGVDLIADRDIGIPSLTSFDATANAAKVTTTALIASSAVDSQTTAEAAAERLVAAAKREAELSQKRAAEHIAAAKTRLKIERRRGAQKRAALALKEARGKEEKAEEAARNAEKANSLAEEAKNQAIKAEEKATKAQEESDRLSLSTTMEDKKESLISAPTNSSIALAIALQKLIGGANNTAGRTEAEWQKVRRMLQQGNDRNTFSDVSSSLIEKPSQTPVTQNRTRTGSGSAVLSSSRVSGVVLGKKSNLTVKQRLERARKTALKIVAESQRLQAEQEQVATEAAQMKKNKVLSEEIKLVREVQRAQRSRDEAEHQLRMAKEEVLRRQKLWKRKKIFAFPVTKTRMMTNLAEIKTAEDGVKNNNEIPFDFDGNVRDSPSDSVESGGSSRIHLHHADMR